MADAETIKRMALLCNALGELGAMNDRWTMAQIDQLQEHVKPEVMSSAALTAISACIWGAPARDKIVFMTNMIISLAAVLGEASMPVPLTAGQMLRVLADGADGQDRGGKIAIGVVAARPDADAKPGSN